MPLALVKARTSSADWKPEEMVMVAESMLVSSTSVMVSSASMALAPSFSVKASVPPAPVRTGASLTEVRLMVEVTAEELSVPSLICQEIVRLLVLGFSDVLL